MPGYQDLSDYLDSLEGRDPNPALAPPQTPMLPDRSALSPQQMQGLQSFAATPPPAPAPKPSPRVSLLPAGGMAQPAAFQSLASSIPADSSGQGAPGAGGTPPTPAPGDSELKAAQAKDARDRALSGLGQGYTRMADLILGRANPTAPAGPTSQSAKDLLARREAARQATADQAQKDLNDPNSAISRRSQLLAAGLMKSAGMDPSGVTGMSAADVQRFKDMLDKGMSVQQAKAALDAENTRSANELQSRKDIATMTQGAEDRRQGRQIEANRQLHMDELAAQRQAKLDEIAAKNSQEKNKPVPEQEASKVVNQGSALPSIDKLEELHDKVGLSGYLPFVNIGAQGRYVDAINALKSSIAAGAAPAARENAELMKSFESGLPKGYSWDDNAHQAFQELRDATQRNMQNQIAALKAGGYSPAQLAELQRQGTGGGRGMPAPHGNTVKQNGVTYTWNPQTGQYE